MKKMLLSALMVIALVTLAACGQEATPTTIPASATPTPDEPTEQLALSEKQRVTSPVVAASDLTDVVDGNSAFAFDLYQALREEDGNLFYSPYSISLALAMTYAGARGETEQQMADSLQFTLPQDSLHPAFNALDLELASRGEELLTYEQGVEAFRVTDQLSESERSALMGGTLQKIYNWSPDIGG